MTSLIVEKPTITIIAGHLIDESLTSSFLSSMGDPDKLKIIQSVMDVAKTSHQMIVDANVPQTSGYRKIKELLADKLLIPDGQIIQKDNSNRAVDVFKAVSEQFIIDFGKNQLAVNIMGQQVEDKVHFFKP